MVDNDLPDGFQLDEMNSDDPQAARAAQGWTRAISDKADHNDTQGAQVVGSPVDFAAGAVGSAIGSAIPGIASSLAESAPQVLGNEIGAIRLTPTGRALGTVSQEAMEGGQQAVQQELKKQAANIVEDSPPPRVTQNEIEDRVKARFGDEISEKKWNQIKKSAVDSNAPYSTIIHKKKHSGFFPNFDAAPTGEIGSVEGLSSPDMTKAWSSDPFGWYDQKYGASKSLLQKHVDSKIPVNVTTASDLIAHDDYSAKLPQGSRVNLVLTQPMTGERPFGSPFPSNGRMAAAYNKLKQQGVDVNFLMRNPESGEIKPLDQFSSKFLSNKHPYEVEGDYAKGGEVKGYADGGDVSGLPQGFRLDQPTENGVIGGPPSGFQLDDDKYGGLKDQVAAGALGVGEGVAGPFATAAARSLGASPEYLRGIKEANPITHGLGETAGFVGSALVPVLGEASLASQVANVGEHVASLLPEATSTIAKIAQTGVKTGAEFAALQGSDEISKAITQDPNQSLGSAAINVGLSGIVGGIGGAAVGSVAPLWKKFTNKSGVEKLITDLQGEADLAAKHGNPVEAATAEINDRIQSADKLIRGGLKKEILEPLMKDVSPEMVQAHVDHVAEEINSVPRALKKSDAFQDAVDEWKDAVFEKPEKPGLPVGGQNKPIEPASSPADWLSGGDENINGVRTPSKYIGIDRLEAIKNDHYTGAGGKEYSEEELEDLLMRKHQKKADSFTEDAVKGLADSAPSPALRSPAEVFRATEDFKRKMQQLSKFNAATIQPSERALVDAAKDIGRDLRMSLEDQAHWGLAGDAQARFNKAVSPLFQSQKDFLKTVASKELGETVADPRKIETLLNQSAKGKAGLKENHIQNFKSITDKAADEVNAIYHEHGLDMPFEDRLNPMSVVSHYLEKDPSAAVKLYRWAQARGAGAAADVAGHVGGEAVGGGLGFLVGHPLAGAWMGDKVLKPVLSALVKPFIEKSVDAEAAKAAVDYAGNVIKGQRALSDAVSNVFKSGSEIIPKHLIPNVASRDDLEKSLNYASTADNAMNVGGKLGHYLPDHSTAAAATTETASNYLKSLKPVQVKQSPLDKPTPADPLKQQQYSRALDVAQQPLMALLHAKKGTLQPVDVQTLKTIYPNLHGQMVSKLFNEMVNAGSSGHQIPYKQRVSLSMLMGQPLDSTMTQAASASIMMANAPKGPPQQQGQPKQSKVSASTAKTMDKNSKLYATPAQSRAASRTAGSS